MRESLIVFIAIPVTLALTLTVFYLYGYTLNRITLFALIFSIGILVDDAIVVVENIVRHLRLPANAGPAWCRGRGRGGGRSRQPDDPRHLAVVAAILPMAFVGGLMGPYMRPDPDRRHAPRWSSRCWSPSSSRPGRPCAFCRPRDGRPRRRAREISSPGSIAASWAPLLHQAAAALGLSRRRRGVLLLASLALVYIQFVKVKMLPFDNKSEFQVIVDMPEGTTLEETARVTSALAAATFGRSPRWSNFQTYAGTASPYQLQWPGAPLLSAPRRRTSADIQVNLLPQGRAQRCRATRSPSASAATARADRRAGTGAASKWPRCRPARPCCKRWSPKSTARPTDGTPRAPADANDLIEQTHGVVDVDWYVEDDQPKQRFVVDGEGRAARHLRGRRRAHAAHRLPAARRPASLHSHAEKEDVLIRGAPDRRRQRSDLRAQLAALKLRHASGGTLVALGESGAHRER